MNMNGVQVQHSFYDPETGVIHPSTVVASSPELLALNTPPGHVAIPGAHAHLRRTHRVHLVTKEVYEHAGGPLPAEAVSQHQLVSAALARARTLRDAAERVTRKAVLGEPGAVDELQKLDAAIDAAQAEVVALSQGRAP